MAIARALIGFNNLGGSVNPTFLFRNRFYLQLSPHCSKMNKKSMWEVKKISRFLSTGHGTLPSCGCKAHETIVSKCELILWGTSPVDWIRLIGPLKHGAILYNEAEVFSLSITNPNRRPMLPFDWLIHSSVILASCHRILFLHVPVFCDREINLQTKIREKIQADCKGYIFYLR